MRSCTRVSGGSRHPRPHGPGGFIHTRVSKGVALLEAIVAITILATAGIAAVTMAAQTARSVRDAGDVEDEIRAASAFLEAVALWPRADLDQRLGDRRQGPWILRIDRAAPELYVVELRDSLAQSIILRTSLFRPRDSSAPK